MDYKALAQQTAQEILGYYQDSSGWKVVKNSVRKQVKYISRVCFLMENKLLQRLFFNIFFYKPKKVFTFIFFVCFFIFHFFLYLTANLFVDFLFLFEKKITVSSKASKKFHGNLWVQFPIYNHGFEFNDIDLSRIQCCCYCC